MNFPEDHEFDDDLCDFLHQINSSDMHLDGNYYDIEVENMVTWIKTKSKDMCYTSIP